MQSQNSAGGQPSPAEQHLSAAATMMVMRLAKSWIGKGLPPRLIAEAMLASGIAGLSELDGDTAAAEFLKQISDRLALAGATPAGRC